MITAFIALNQNTTTSQIAMLTGLSPTRTRELLQELVADGVIEKIGNYRYASYTMKKPNGSNT
jgi:DNA-binding Lrp family transcriptional regulator